MVIGKLSYGAFLGRMEPPHFSHIAPIRMGLDSHDFMCIVLGSYLQAITSKNPWTCAEREAMLRSCFNAEEQLRMKFIYAEDVPHCDNQWAHCIRRKLEKEIGTDADLTLYEYHKDATTQQAIESLRSGLRAKTRFYSSDSTLSSTLARRSILLESKIPAWIPESIRHIIASEFLGTQRHDWLRKEQIYLDAYHKSWAGSPFPPCFNASDALCKSGQKILMIRRGKEYGYNQLALPGGFLDANKSETLFQACLRELREETAIYDIERYARSKNALIFDQAGRSLRGRVISHAFRFDVPEGAFALAEARDDAKEIQIVDVSEVETLRSEMFEDHYWIIQRLLEMDTSYGSENAA